MRGRVALVDPVPPSAIVVSAGGYHACSLIPGQHGGVVCWGKNDNGQLGIESTLHVLAVAAQNSSIVDLGSGVLLLTYIIL